jgi:flagellin-like hook-associated protein FlgL
MVQSQNGSLNATDYQALQVAAQGYLDTIKQQSVALDGTGKPIFASIVNQVQIEPNVTVNTNLKFSDVFGGSGSGKIDVLQKIQDFVNYLGNLASGKTMDPGRTFSINTTANIGSTIGTDPTNYSGISVVSAGANAMIGTYRVNSTILNGGPALYLTDGSGNQTTPVPISKGMTNIDFGNGVSIALSTHAAGSSASDITAALSDSAHNTIIVTSNTVPGTTQTVADGLDQAFTQISLMQEAAGAIAKRVDDAKGATTSIGTNLAATSSAKHSR